MEYNKKDTFEEKAKKLDEIKKLIDKTFIDSGNYFAPCILETLARLLSKCLGIKTKLILTI